MWIFEGNCSRQRQEQVQRPWDRRVTGLIVRRSMWPLSILSLCLLFLFMSQSTLNYSYHYWGTVLNKVITLNVIDNFFPWPVRVLYTLNHFFFLKIFPSPSVCDSLTGFLLVLLVTYYFPYLCPFLKSIEASCLSLAFMSSNPIRGYDLLPWVGWGGKWVHINVPIPPSRHTQNISGPNILHKNWDSLFL